MSINNHIRPLPDFDNWVSAYIEAWDRQAARKEKEMERHVADTIPIILSGEKVYPIREESTRRTLGFAYDSPRNSQLWAAAPDLLAALEGLLTESSFLFRQMVNHQEDYSTTAAQTARAAIAKAKGE